MEPRGELHAHHPDFTQITSRHHLAGLVDHLETAVTVRHTDNPVAFERQVRQFPGFLGRKAERLFTDYMQVVFEGCFANSEMCSIRRGDGHHFDTVRPVRFSGNIAW